jgi:arylsulfatase A-like enzyme
MRIAVSRLCTPITLLLAAFLQLACGAAPPDRIVVITLDTTRADALGAYGQRDPTTPRIDAMAAGGLLFEHVVSSAPSTLPSHATLFTGKQPYAHGVRSNTGYQLAIENETLAERLRARGWSTHAEVAAPVMDARTGLDQGFEVYRGAAETESQLDVIERHQHSRRYTRPAEEITERGLAFLREHADRPFFLWLHYFDPHEPLDPPKRFLPGLPPYYAEIRRVDHHVGRVLDELEALGLRERTIVVLTADHGEGLGQHGEDTHSFLVYETTMRVPLVFWGAEVVPRGRRAPALVRVVDVTPTLLDLVGLAPLAGVQGVSLRPLFEDPARDLDLVGYGESAEAMMMFGSSVLRFVRQGRWKYIHKLEPELYDLDDDPREVQNLAVTRADKLEELRRRLYELIEAAPAPAGDTQVTLDAESIAELQALGYVALEGAAGIEDERAALEVRGPDPSERVGAVHRFARAIALVGQKRDEEALVLLRSLIAETPESRAIHRLLVDAAAGAGDEAEQRATLREGLRLEPDSMRYRVMLAERIRDDEPREAERLLREASALAGCDPAEPALNLAQHLKLQARREEQRTLLEERMQACPEVPSLRNALAWLLATAPDAKLRDGPRAVRLAEQALRQAGDAHADYVDTLAAAYAEAGDLERALAEQRRALALLEGRDLPPRVVDPFREHLMALEAGRPVRDP